MFLINFEAVIWKEKENMVSNCPILLVLYCNLNDSG